MIDLDDISNCPLAGTCAVCGNTEDLDVGTLGTPVGVFCITLCPACVEYDQTPRLTPVAAVRASLEHCAHLGIDADQMAEAMS